MKYSIVLMLIFFWANNCAAQDSARVKVVIRSINGYSKHEDFARLSASLFEQFLNSTEFKERVLSGHYLRTNGLSNEDLFNQIIKAHEIEGRRRRLCC